MHLLQHLLRRLLRLQVQLVQLRLGKLWLREACLSQQLPLADGISAVAGRESICQRNA